MPDRSGVSSRADAAAAERQSRRRHGDGAAVAEGGKWRAFTLRCCAVTGCACCSGLCPTQITQPKAPGWARWQAVLTKMSSRGCKHRGGGGAQVSRFQRLLPPHLFYHWQQRQPSYCLLPSRPLASMAGVGAVRVARSLSQGELLQVKGMTVPITDNANKSVKHAHAPVSARCSAARRSGDTWHRWRQNATPGIGGGKTRHLACSASQPLSASQCRPASEHREPEAVSWRRAGRSASWRS